MDVSTSSASGSGLDCVPRPAQPHHTPSESQIAEANRRLALVETYRALRVDQGLTPNQAARRMGESRTTLDRYTHAFAAHGYNGLVPAWDKSGRRSTLDKLAAEIGSGAVQEALDAVRGLKLDTESNTTAWRLYAQSDRCPEPLARVVLDPNRSSKHALPPSLRKATRLNEALHDAHRGPRRLALKGMWTPRQLDILPGDVFSADDTTPIWAWWVPWETSKEYPYGVKLLQGQFLPVIDVASQCALCFVLIARERGSYRAADIWHLFGHTFETIGLPRLGWQLERGSWESNLIAGVEIDYRDGEATLSRRVGGLRQLPTNVTEWHRQRLGSDAAARLPKTLQTWTSFLPKSKSIEAFFDRSQTLEGTIYGSLGRDQMRKPYEKAKRQYEACRRGAADPRLHFLSQVELVTRLRAMLDYLNNEPMEGEVFKGIPRLTFDAAVREHPLFILPEDQRWLYRRDWKVVQITQGWARVRLTHELSGERYSLFYTNPRRFAEHEGEDVVVYYDREHFEAPAQVLLARTGEYLCEAEYVERRGSFLDGDRTGHDIRAAWRNAVMSTYGTIVSHAPSRQIPTEIAARRNEARVAGGEGRSADSPTVVAVTPALNTASRANPLAAPSPEQFAKRTNRFAALVAATAATTGAAQ